MLKAQEHAISTYESAYTTAVYRETDLMYESRNEIVTFIDTVTKVLGFSNWQLGDFTLEPDESDTLLLVPNKGRALITKKGIIHVPIRWPMVASANGQDLAFDAFWMFFFKYPAESKVVFEGWMDEWISVHDDDAINERMNEILPRMLESIAKRAEKAGQNWVRSNQRPDP